MTASIIVVLALCAPPLLMWWLIRVQRRVRAMPRAAADSVPAREPFVDAVTGPDGLAYARSFEVNEELLAATRRSAEASDIKNLEGRR